MGDKRKMYNKNYDKAYKYLKVRQKRKGKFYATDQVHESQCIGLIEEFHIVKLFFFAYL
jgi:hypothetical protein